MLVKGGSKKLRASVVSVSKSIRFRGPGVRGLRFMGFRVLGFRV